MTCAVLGYETIYNGTNNAIELVLLENDNPLIDLSAISRVIFTIGGNDYDSQSLPAGSIAWDNTVDYYGQTVQVITAKLGQAGIVAGDYSGSRLKVYDPANPQGVVWTDALNIRVKD